MEEVIITEKKPIKSWVSDLEEGALEQTRNLANLPFLFKHVALMADAHQGYGMPIGGILATQKTVVPNAVGVDIGCGMCIAKSTLKAKDLSKTVLKKIMSKIREQVPVGFNHHETEQEGVPEIPENVRKISDSIVVNQHNPAKKQLGTLGGGNHFIEIQKGDDGFVYIMVHSGSRNLGKRVCDHYNKIAKGLNEKYYSQVESSSDLAFLPLDTQQAKNYMAEMEYCLEFALRNRLLMMDRIKKIFNEETNCEFTEFHNIHHNYAAFENHFKSNVIIHRKGATRAREGEIGIIPGSQGTFSFVVRGLGNKDSFHSCSHGAGRKMGRNVARRTLNIEEETKKLNDKGVIHAIRNLQDLDEAPGAYKDIEQVMDNQKDLVEIVTKLEPLAVIKG